MNAFFHPFRVCVATLCFLFCFYLPLATTAAKLTGEIIFTDPIDYQELWIGKVSEGHSARRIYRFPTLGFEELSVQKDSRYIVGIAGRFDEVADHDPQLGTNAYLLDRNKRYKGAKNLTQARFGTVIDAAISQKGEVVFTNKPFVNGVVQEQGIFLIRNQEILWRDPPKAKLLKRAEAYQVDWAPHGEQIVYNTDAGIFLLNVFDRKTTQLTTDGSRPVFSPNGKKIAFFMNTEPPKIGILSLATPHAVTYIDLKEPDDTPGYLVWSSDGRYLVYTLVGHNLSYANYAVPLAGGPQQRVFEQYAGGVEIFEWTHTALSVEPAKKLTTLWGALKTHENSR